MNDEATFTQCGAKTRSGTPCKRAAGSGTEHKGFGNCKHHGGNTPSGIKYAQKLMAGEQVVVYGLPREIDPHSALIEELHRTAGHVAYLAGVIKDLQGDQDLKQYQTGDNGTIERPSVWIELYHEERKHFMAIAKTCISVGIEERRIRLAEEQGELLAEVVRGIVSDLGHDLKDPAVGKIVRLRLIEGGANAAAA